MMDSRVFTSVFQGVSVSAAQDLLSLLASSSVPLKLISARIGQSSDFGDAQDELLRVRIRRGMTTAGSGGSAPSMYDVDKRRNATSSATCRANDTTAASGGTIEELYEETFNVRSGWIYMPTPEERLVCAVSTRIAINLPAAPVDPLTLSGEICWMEL